MPKCFCDIILNCAPAWSVSGRVGCDTVGLNHVYDHVVPARAPIAYSGYWAAMCAMYSVLMIMIISIFFMFVCFGCERTHEPCVPTTMSVYSLCSLVDARTVRPYNVRLLA